MTSEKPQEVEAGRRRRSSLYVTQIEIPFLEVQEPEYEPQPSKRSSISLSTSLLFPLGSLRKNRSGSMNLPKPTGLLSADGSLKKSRSGSMNLPNSMRENNNPYLQRPRRSLGVESGVRRLSVQDLALMHRDTASYERRASAAADATRRQSSERSPSTSPALGRRRRGSFSSAGSASVCGSRGEVSGDSAEDRPDGRGGLAPAKPPPKSASTGSFVSSVGRFISTTLLGRELEEEVATLDVATQHAMDYENDDRYRKQFRDGELIVWDPETGIGDMMAPGTMKRPAVRALIAALTAWINEALGARRVIVLDIFQDLFDGQVLGELMEVLSGEHRATVDTFCIAERLKKERLRRVLVWVDTALGRRGKDAADDDGDDDDSNARRSRADETPWNVERIWQQDVIATLHLLVALNRHFASTATAATQPLPENVSIEVHRNEVHMATAQLLHKNWREHLTGIAGLSLTTGGDSDQLRADADVIDKFFAQVPGKIAAAEGVLLEFANLHLTKLSFQAPLTDFREDFRDGVSLVMLLCVLGGFCVPLHELRLPAQKEDDRANNLLLAFRLMRDARVPHPGVDRPDDIMQGSAKATMRVLFALFKQYKFAV